MTAVDKTFEKQAFAALEKVIDPEIRVDLVSLGLIYGVTCDASGLCTVTMTLTMMGCPLTDVLNQAISEALMTLVPVQKVKINLVWDPIWTIDKMSREARVQLGMW
ncbi:putative aromatic ring hydroxylating enzyme [Pediococcus damnosus]|uniref:Aromatic ring hydroxylating enzyme n=1 Tax=Pediococcus damnosus TaxID=51663 RepID=A0A143AMA1_9LACO|nr:metal-sulfur cluster assembly factor [Pediococcus damnosus]AMV60815.1 putative aromatic ring hydroxylating enzyme [Pediococcus damnosus]AMV63401.1 putative aromatic ring hydroxylating enzyme [Pediococcus damnosus]AMV65125.1 putative aromatic ring hydroxylating enzyme [Pediococcus damnosus]AMV66692.1 putative aromatic ring hydroxylating enzyme [Pediococcus damnosus]AMV69936.1 putative aromatic ring hydroxylating enzyme [Pediococcus damnosus]